METPAARATSRIVATRDSGRVGPQQTPRGPVGPVLMKTFTPAAAVCQYPGALGSGFRRSRARKAARSNATPRPSLCAHAPPGSPCAWKRGLHGPGESGRGRNGVGRGPCPPRLVRRFRRGSRGFFFYLRDRESGRFWSAARKPVTWGSGARCVASRAGSLSAARSTASSPPWTSRSRRNGRSSCAGSRREPLGAPPDRGGHELPRGGLDHPAAFRAHPPSPSSFSRRVRGGRPALLVHRRPRSAGELHPWLVHALVEGEVREYETDRVRFLGRGGGAKRRSPSARRRPFPGPRATSSTRLSLRTVLVLEPGGPPR